MKTLNSFIVLLLIATILTTSSCDKVEMPYPTILSIDTTFYSGNWTEYINSIAPQFIPLQDQVQNVLLEEYTGHLCNNCPTAAAIAHNIHKNNPNRVFIASIHAGPGGKTSFQQANPNDDKFYTDHTNSDGLAYGQRFQNGFNFFGNPQGTVNRKNVDQKVFDFSGTWQTRVTNLLSNTPKVRLQAKFNYFEETKGGYLHVHAQHIGAISSKLNTVVYVIQDSLIDWQLMPNNSYNPDYTHYDKHLGSINGLPWGETTFTPTGNKTEIDLLYSYKIPSTLKPEEIYFLIYIYDKDTYEILQVIKERVTII
jgi:hypothetical protein